MPKRPDWSRRLPRPIVIPKLMTIATLADVRKLMRYLPKDHRERSTWQHVAAELDKAAAGADTADVSIALRLVLMIEKVETRQ
jgi:2-keto-3-deoxy-L-rhamnonate aldolase RhmA